MRKNKYVAFKCLDCKAINVFTKYKADGRKCISCGGRLFPEDPEACFINSDIIKENKDKPKHEIKINCDAKELNNVIDAAKTLNKELEAAIYKKEVLNSMPLNTEIKEKLLEVTYSGRIKDNLYSPRVSGSMVISVTDKSIETIENAISNKLIADNEPLIDIRILNVLEK